MVPLVAPTFFDQLPKWLGPITHSGITLAAVSAVVLNAFFNGRARRRRRRQRELAEVAKGAGVE